MYQGSSGRAQRSPGGPSGDGNLPAGRGPPGRFPSPDPRWGSPFPGSPRGFSPEFSPRFSAGSNQGHYRQDQDGSPGSYGGWSRGYAGQMPGRAHGFRRPQNFSPSFSPNAQVRKAPESRGLGVSRDARAVVTWLLLGSQRSEPGVEKFFGPSMLQDPWKDLQPVTADEAAARRMA
uniref:M-phase specific PLK1 interacting protein n=1 Tax=Oryzias latipes TaxID=8090 RepID=A0A3P9J6E7_ORYLA